MKKSVIGLMMVLALSGCMSVDRSAQGDFKLRSFGQDIKGDIEYARITTNGSVESFSFNGSKNATESTHTVANLISSVVGAIIGSSAGPGGTATGAAGGAAIGGSLSEAWQSLKDYLNKDKSDTAPAPVQDATPPASITNPPSATGETITPAVASGPLVMPLAQHGNEAQIDAWLASGGAPECGGSGRRDVRAQLLRPSGKSWGYAPFWASGALEYNADGSQVRFRDVTFEGQAYRFIGYSTGENLSEATRAAAGTWINYTENGHGMFTFWECRAL